MKARHWANPCDTAVLLWHSMTRKERDLTGVLQFAVRLQHQNNIMQHRDNDHAQSLIKVKAHIFEWKGAVSRKTVLKIHHLCFVSHLMFGKYHKSPAARFLLHHCAPKVALGGFGGGEWRKDKYLAPNSSHLLLQTSFPFIATTATWCLLQGILELFLPALLILCFWKFHMLLPFILSYLSCTTLREWSPFSDSLKKELLSWGWRLRANAEDDRTSLPEKCVAFPYLSGKGFITLSSKGVAQPPRVQPHLPTPEPRYA